MWSIFFAISSFLAVIGDGSIGNTALERAKSHNFKVKSITRANLNDFVKQRRLYKAVVIDATKVSPAGIRYVRDMYNESLVDIHVIDSFEDAQYIVDRMFGLFLSILLLSPPPSYHIHILYGDFLVLILFFSFFSSRNVLIE